MATEHLGVCGKLSKNVDQCLVHLLSTSFKEPAAAPQEESVPGEDHLVAGLGDVVADVASGVTWGEETGDMEATHCQLITMLHKSEVESRRSEMINNKPENTNYSK